MMVGTEQAAGNVTGTGQLVDNPACMFFFFHLKFFWSAGF
jgi:hypothetical protein